MSFILCVFGGGRGIQAHWDTWKVQGDRFVESHVAVVCICGSVSSREFNYCERSYERNSLVKLSILKKWHCNKFLHIMYIVLFVLEPAVNVKNLWSFFFFFLRGWSAKIVLAVVFTQYVAGLCWRWRISMRSIAWRVRGLTCFVPVRWIVFG